MSQRRIKKETTNKSEKKSKSKPKEKPTVRHVTDPDELKEILTGTEIKETKISPEDYAE